MFSAERERAPACGRAHRGGRLQRPSRCDVAGFELEAALRAGSVSDLFLLQPARMTQPSQDFFLVREGYLDKKPLNAKSGDQRRYFMLKRLHNGDHMLMVGSRCKGGQFFLLISML